MKKLMLVGLMAILLSACAETRIVSPAPPSNDAIKSKYRKTVEVVLVQCQQRDYYIKTYDGNYKPKTVKDSDTISIVETTDTGERFEVHGCYGKVGDRFKISY